MDEVRLAVPALPSFVRLARVTASGLASRLGFSYDEGADLRLAIDELCSSLIGSRGKPGMVELRYLVRAEALEVHGIGRFDASAGVVTPTPLTELSQRILDALVDEHSLSANGGKPQ